MPELPPPHPAVVSMFVKPVPSARYRFFPVNLDVKQTEIARNLLVDDATSAFVADWHPAAIPVFLSTDPNLEQIFCAIRPKLCVILDLHDKGRKLDFVGLTDLMWSAIEMSDLQVLYFKLQVHEAKKYEELNRRSDHVHILSMPLLPGGSRFHITVQEDFEGDSLFSRTLEANPSPSYDFDWSWVGATTSDDRKAAFESLTPFEKYKRFCTISAPGHADASVATVPQSEYLRISRASKICLSLNGRGPWCLKDGELFTKDCFVLRQDHPSLTLHPLSPMDGKHWALAGTDELIGAIEHFAHADAQREAIRHAGHAYMSDVLQNHLWSREHLRRLERFVQSRSKRVWDGIAIA